MSRSTFASLASPSSRGVNAASDGPAPGGNAVANMASPRGRRLPQLHDGWYLTDGGLETTAIFHDRLELPQNAAFVLLRSERGRDWLRRYYRRYLGIAAAAGRGFVFETPTWRASPDWAWKLDVSLVELDALNTRAALLMREIANEAAIETGERVPYVVSGCVGPRRDGYAADLAMSADEADEYHRRQVAVFARAGVDFVTATTMTNSAEAIGVADAAASLGLPAVVSFTVETDGNLPTGQSLGGAITEVDATALVRPAYYMINCAHPTHFYDALDRGGDWVQRVRGLRANSSCRSHAELDESPTLDSGDPQQLAREHRALLARHPQLAVLGGCCGTDHRHIEAIAQACGIAA